MYISEINQKRLPQAAVATVKPSVAIVLPYNPKMSPRQEIDSRLQRVLSAAEKQLLAAHPAEAAMPVVRKLQQLARKLNASTHKVSVALFASEDVAKVTYMDFAVDERVMVDQPFRVRDIAGCKPSAREYLVLLLSAKESRMYCNNGTAMRMIKSNTPQNVFAWLNEVPERTANFSDPDSRREVMLNKFLHHMDEGLGAVLRVYPLPVFVVGTERVTGHFAAITRHDRNIAGYLHKQGIDASETELEEMLQPLLSDWHRTKQQLLVRQMEKAAEAGKLVCGIHEARKAAGWRNSRLIIVGSTGETENPEAFYFEGEVDEIVEKVLESGGEVEKIDDHLLKPYGPVALIKYY
ncbi:baeRF3 domain-containing protein [Puia dinghuensis]|uniref:Uncharacterized protein n=1 Tax=Puia dinghuensis TaxID=1792502 RepID=A0A8J2UC33_9BACT|nr:hypothetical protein [Puia dinghuensis]GGA94791.1 hypothetical protein GCM10011511_17630 [Puia dinghuensis]